MPTKGTQTNRSGAPPADRHDALIEEMTAAWVADFVQVLGKCTRLSVPNVARTLKCHSFPGATGPYIAAIATASNAPAALATGHTDNRIERFGRAYA